MQLDTGVETRLTERIDEFLKEISGTSLVDAGKAIDFCLDIRQIVNNYKQQED
jgi:hypothetical protein